MGRHSRKNAASKQGKITTSPRGIEDRFQPELKREGKNNRRENTKKKEKKEKKKKEREEKRKKMFCVNRVFLGVVHTQREFWNQVRLQLPNSMGGKTKKFKIWRKISRRINPKDKQNRMNIKSSGIQKRDVLGKLGKVS